MLLVLHYAGGGTEYGIDFLPAANNTSAAVFFNAAVSEIGNINTTSTATAYNTTSDRRLKENITDTALGLDALKRISVRDFHFISDPQKIKTQGFIAQELYTIYPYAVTVGGDDPNTNPWSVDYGRLTPLIIKSIQEQQGQISDISGQLSAVQSQLSHLLQSASSFTEAVVGTLNAGSITTQELITDSLTVGGQALHTKIKEQERQIDELKADNDELKARLEKLEILVSAGSNR